MYEIDDVVLRAMCIIAVVKNNGAIKIVSSGQPRAVCEDV